MKYTWFSDYFKNDISKRVKFRDFFSLLWRNQVCNSSDICLDCAKVRGKKRRDIILLGHMILDFEFGGVISPLHNAFEGIKFLISGN